MVKIQLKHLYYKIKNGFRNISRFFKVIWNNYNNDYHFTYVLLKLKIKYTIVDLNNTPWKYVGYERDLEVMNTALRLLDYIIKNDDTVIEKYEKLFWYIMSNRIRKIWW